MTLRSTISHYVSRLSAIAIIAMLVGAPTGLGTPTPEPLAVPGLDEAVRVMEKLTDNLIQQGLLEEDDALPLASSIQSAYQQLAPLAQDPTVQPGDLLERLVAILQSELPGPLPDEQATALVTGLLPTATSWAYSTLGAGEESGSGYEESMAIDRSIAQYLDWIADCPVDLSVPPGTIPDNEEVPYGGLIIDYDSGALESLPKDATGPLQEPLCPFHDLAMSVLNVLLIVVLPVLVLILVVPILVAVLLVLVVLTAPGAVDENADGLGDEWAKKWGGYINQILDSVQDLDADGLQNVDEFRWKLVPLCLPFGGFSLPPGVDPIQNCKDHDADRLTGADGDEWLDGQEVWYWNDERNDDLTAPGVAFYDPDRLLDTDGDGIANINDTDSDNDGLLDGPDFYTYGSYPEYADSDCSPAATACTVPARDDSPHYGVRVGNPGTGDGLLDGVEVQAWNDLLGDGAWAADLDGDGIHNLLDPDSDGDGLSDGQEHLAIGSSMGDFDTDRDALLDGSDTLVAASDPRYQEFTDAGIIYTDLEGGRLFHGESTASTDPTASDSDGDGLPDGYEVHYGLDPRNPTDAGLDSDSDAYNPEGNATPEGPWTNLQEHEYLMPSWWNTSQDGVYWLGTDPTNEDTDGDGVADGVEVHTGTDPLDGADADYRFMGGNRGPDDAAWEAAWKSDPTNEDLPEHLMDATNLQYLREERADAAARANETVEVADELVSAAIAGNVSRALDVVYNRTPLGPPLRNATETVAITQEALASLVRCAPEQARPALETALGSPDWVPQAQRIPGDPHSLAPQPPTVGGAPDAAGTPPAEDPVNTTAPYATDTGNRTLEYVVGEVDAVVGHGIDAMNAANAYAGRGVEDAWGFAGEKAEAINGSLPEDPPQLPMPNATDLLEAPVPYTWDQGNQSADATDSRVGCVTETLLPYLDTLLNRTLNEVPIVGDHAAQMRHETLPAAIDALDAIVPVPLQATAESFLQSPIATAEQTIIDGVNTVSDPTSLQEAVTQTRATVQVTAAGLIPAIDRHPQFLYETVSRLGAQAYWDLIQEANDETESASDDRVHPIAAVDSIRFNLYTNRSGDEAITPVPVGNRTCVQLSDSNETTRDSLGCDLYVTLTVTKDSASSPATLPSQGSRVTPSIVIETALPSARFELEALGYLQLRDSPHVLVLGYATTGQGQPQQWTGTLVDYDTKQEWSDRSMTSRFTYEDARSSIPLHTVTGVFEVDVSEPGKPVVGDNTTVLELESPGAPPSVAVALHRVGIADEESRVEASLEADGAADWMIHHRATIGGNESRFALNATGVPGGTSRITSTFGGAPGASWQWSSPADTDALEASYQEFRGQELRQSFHVSAADVPDTVLVRTDPLIHLHSFVASAAPTAFDLMAAQGTDACPVFDAALFLAVESQSDSLCLAADLAGYASLQVQDLDDRVHATGSREVSSTDSTIVLVDDGNTAYAALSASPASWTGSFVKNAGNVRALEWSASQAIDSLQLEADLGDSGEALRVNLTDTPKEVAATLDAVRNVGELSASDYVGVLDWVTSTTGTAPSAASPGDHVRLRELDAGVEASWHTTDVQALVARVSEDGAWEASGSFASPRLLEVGYEDESHNVHLQATDVSGEFLFRLQEDPGAGSFRYLHESASPPSFVGLVGELQDSRVHVELSGPASDVSLEARLDAQRVLLDASGPVSVEARYGAGGAHPTMEGEAFVLVGGTASETPGLHVRLPPTSSLDVLGTPSTVELHTSFVSATPLVLRFDQGQDAVLVDLEEAPGEATVTTGPGSLTWSSLAPATTFSYHARDSSRASLLTASTSQAPSSLDVSWSPRAVDAFETAVTHDGSTLPSLQVESHDSTPTGEPVGQSGHRFVGEALPASFSARFEPQTGRLTASGSTVSGEPAVVGLIDIGFGQRQDTWLALPVAAGTSAYLVEAESGISGALRASDLESLSVRLFGDEQGDDAAGTVDLQRSVGGPLRVRVEVPSQEASSRVDSDWVPGDVRLSLWPGLEAGGFRVATEASAAGGALTADLVREGRVLSTRVSAMPASLDAAWSPGSPVEVAASSPTDVEVQAASTQDTVLGHAGWDHVAVKPGQNNGSMIALGLSSVSRLLLDPVQGVFELETTSGWPVLVDHLYGQERLRVLADPAPSHLDAAWDPATRALTVDASSPMSRFLVSTDPGGADSQRILAILEGVPSGITSFMASPDGPFTLDAPSVLSNAAVTSDVGTGPASVLEGHGVRVQSAQEQAAIYLNLPGTEQAELTLPRTGAPRLDFDRGAILGSAATVRLGLPDQRLMADMDALPGGTSSLAWPSPAAMQFTADGFLDRDIRLGFDAGSERGQVTLTDSPGSWDFAFTETGIIDYTGIGPASGLDGFASYRGAAFILDADGVPSDLHIMPDAGMTAGQATSSGSVDRLKMALASSGGSGNAAIPVVQATGQDLFSVDATGGNGVLTVDLPNVQNILWSLPDSAGRVAGTPLSLDLELSSSTMRAATIQFLHPDHQSLVRFDGGLPADLGMDLSRTTTEWTLGLDSDGKDYQLQHQGSDSGLLRVASTGAPASSVLRVEPKADRAVEYTASGSTGRLLVQSRWDGGFLDADLVGASMRFRLESGGSQLLGGTVSTLGSGSVDRARLLLVPDASNTVNRVNPAREHFAVDAMAKAPYLGLNLGAFEEASWQLPELTGSRPVTGSIERASMVPGTTWVVLSGPREDVTARIKDAAESIEVHTVPAGSAPDRSPLVLGITSSGEGSGEVALTHVDAESGQLANARIQDAVGTTTMRATGAEPAFIDIEGDAPRDAVFFETTDQGTVLQLGVEDPTPRLRAEVTRGTCGVTTPFQGEVSTLGTGSTGPLKVLIGDQGRVPMLRGTGLDARCTGGQTKTAYQAPGGEGMRWDTTECAAEYEFVTTRSGSRHSVETEDGYFHARMAADSDQEIEFAEYQFTDGDGVLRDMSSRLRYLEEEVTLPTCQQFRQSPVESYRLNAKDVPTDLELNINPQETGAGEDLPTLRLVSPAGATTGELVLNAVLADRAFEQFHDAQMEALSPFGRLDAFIGNAEQQAKRPAQHSRDSDGFNFVWEGKDIHWHMQFTDIQRLDGWAVRKCTTMEYDIIYERIPGTPERTMRDHLNLNQGCDRNLLEFDSLPQEIEYEVTWNNLMDMNLIIERSTGAIDNLALWADGHCFGNTCVDAPGPLYFMLLVDGIPQGRLDVLADVGFRTGIINIQPAQGRVDRLDFGLAPAGRSDHYATLGISNVNFKTEWDIDGDTRYWRTPAYWFIDSRGGFTSPGDYMDASGRLRAGKFGAGIGGAFFADGWQLRVEMKNMWLVDVPFLKRAGLMCGALKPQFLLDGEWWGFPVIEKDTAGCL